MDKGPKDHIEFPHNKRQKGSPPSPSQMSLDDSTEGDEKLLKALAVSMEQQPQASLPQDGNTEENYQSKEQDKVSEKEDSAPITNPVYPPLPEEGKGDKNLLCRVRVRLPDGQRIQRNFLRTDSTHYYGPSATPSSKERSETSLSVSQKPSLAHPELWITTVIKLLKKPSSQMPYSLKPGCESLNSRRIFSKASSENAAF